MNVLAHLVGGTALAVAFSLLLKREPELRRPLLVPAVLFAIAIAFALYLVWVGNLREQLLPFAFRLARSVGRPRTLGSYCSQNDLALTFGPGKDKTVRAIEIEWPSGQKDRIVNVPANEFLIIEEGEGIAKETAPGPRFS